MSSSPLTSELSTPETKMTPEEIEGMQVEEDEEETEEDECMEDVDLLLPSNVDYKANIRHPQHQKRKKRVFHQKALGTTLLPVARVSRAAKQNKDIKILSKEAVFLISIATELFIKKLTDSAFERSKKEKRVFVKYNDIAMAVKRNAEYDWLEEVIPTSLPLGTILRDPTIPSASTTLTNSLPTHALFANSSLPHSQPTLLEQKNSNLHLSPVLDDVDTDMNDEDQLDEEL